MAKNDYRKLYFIRDLKVDYAYTLPVLQNDHYDIVCTLILWIWKGKLYGTKTFSFKICGNLGRKVTGVSLEKIANKTYSGNAQKPKPWVKAVKTDGTIGRLTPGTDFTYSYKYNTNVGQATSKITGKGNYTGTKTVTFKINPKGTSIKGVTAKSKGFRVTWNKQATQTTGYQVWISSKSDFSTKATKTIAKTGTLSATFTGLKAKTKYYVKVRTYRKKSNGNVYYSAWSAVKTVTTKA